jgi:periplasmic divalent cation tolerance protein
MDTNNYTIIMTTFENEDQANVVINDLLEKKLAACIQIQNIKSFYTWKGKIESGSELLVYIKTLKNLYLEIESLILKNHPYDTPEIIQVPIVDGYIGYLKWIDDVTK